jgi:putative flavoprotein involved in K+ transport
VDSNAPVTIIGGGQAGLAIAYSLQRRGIPCRILDAAARTGDAWRSRYDSLVLFTPAQYSGLPGLPMPLPHDHYPTKDEAADYLERYARYFGFDVVSDCRVERLTREDDGYRLHLADGIEHARRVVVATGAAQQQSTPAFARSLAPAVFQVHSSAYKNPGQLPDGNVVVVGAGNSGAQIAAELSQDRVTHLAYERLPKRIPQRLLGRDVFWWLIRIGMMDRKPGLYGVDYDGSGPPTSGDVAASIPLIGSTISRRIRSGAIQRQRRVIGAEGDRLYFAGGGSLVVDSVVWATGFRNDFSWIDVPGAIEAGRPVQRGGVSPSPGLYFIGLPGMRSKGSAFLGFVGRDAEHLAGILVSHG